jgi:hypothetical protein
MPLYIAALISAAATAYFNGPGLDGLYRTVWWYDIFMHILGGLAVGLLVCALINSLRLSWTTRTRLAFSVIAVVLAVGLAWEVFEVYHHLTGYPVGSTLYYKDTILDLIDDMIGAVLALLVFIKLRKKVS